MAWCQIGDKPLPEPMPFQIPNSLTHTCDTKEGGGGINRISLTEEKMGDILQTTNDFLEIFCFEFSLRFGWTLLFPVFRWTTNEHGLRQRLGNALYVYTLDYNRYTWNDSRYIWKTKWIAWYWNYVPLIFCVGHKYGIGTCLYIMVLVRLFSHKIVWDHFEITSQKIINMINQYHPRCSKVIISTEATPTEL